MTPPAPLSPIEEKKEKNSITRFTIYNCSNKKEKIQHLPYPSLGGMMIFLLSPTFISKNVSSQPRITCPAPTRNENGLLRSRDESNFLIESNPSNHPVYCVLTVWPAEGAAPVPLNSNLI